MPAACPGAPLGSPGPSSQSDPVPSTLLPKGTLPSPGPPALAAAPGRDGGSVLPLGTSQVQAPSQPQQPGPSGPDLPARPEPLPHRLPVPSHRDPPSRIQAPSWPSPAPFPLVQAPSLPDQPHPDQSEPLSRLEQPLPSRTRPLSSSIQTPIPGEPATSRGGPGCYKSHPDRAAPTSSRRYWGGAPLQHGGIPGFGEGAAIPDGLTMEPRGSWGTAGCGPCGGSRGAEPRSGPVRSLRRVPLRRGSWFELGSTVGGDGNGEEERGGERGRRRGGGNGTRRLHPPRRPRASPPGPVPVCVPPSGGAAGTDPARWQLEGQGGEPGAHAATHPRIQSDAGP